MYTVKLNDGKIFDCSAEQTILDAAKCARIALEYSCRSGRCGICKVRVLHGQSHAIQSEESLTDSERGQGFILTCSYAPDSDLKLNTEDLGRIGRLETKTLPCKIDSLSYLAPNVLEVVLRMPPTTELEYIPGQYIDVIGPDGIRRSYSIANAPQNNGKLTLHIKKVPEGVLSNYWFEHARVNDLLRMEGPLGTFCLRESTKPNLLLLATGTGIAPIKAMLEELNVTNELKFEKIYLYWGGRHAQDLYWRPEFNNLPLRVIKVISSEKTVIYTHKRYVQHAALQDGVDLGNSTAYACGSEFMIRDSKKLLIEHGLESKNFYSDAFVSSN